MSLSRDGTRDPYVFNVGYSDSHHESVVEVRQWDSEAESWGRMVEIRGNPQMISQRYPFPGMVLAWRCLPRGEAHESFRGWHRVRHVRRSSQRRRRRLPLGARVRLELPADVQFGLRRDKPDDDLRVGVPEERHLHRGMRRLIRASQRREGRLRRLSRYVKVVHSDVQRRLRAQRGQEDELQRRAGVLSAAECRKRYSWGDAKFCPKYEDAMFCRSVKTEADCLAASSKRNCKWSSGEPGSCYHDDDEFDEMTAESYYHDFAADKCWSVDPWTRGSCVAVSGCDWFEWGYCELCKGERQKDPVRHRRPSRREQLF